MNWDAIGALGEVLGSVAVFVTLGYLAVQLRHARSETRRSLSQGRMEANREIISLELLDLEPRRKVDASLGLDPIPAVAALMNVAELTWEEAYRAFMVEVAAWNYRVWVITNIEDLQPAQRQLFDGAIRVRYQRSGVSKFVYDTHFKPSASPEIVQYVENIISDTESVGVP